MKPQKRVFEITTRDFKGDKVRFEFEQDHYAEQVLRGLVHSGYAVTIIELKKDYTEEELKELEKNGYIGEHCPPPVPARLY